MNCNGCRRTEEYIPQRYGKTSTFLYYITFVTTHFSQEMIYIGITSNKLSSLQVPGWVFVCHIIIIIIGIQPLGQSGQRPELSQSTGTALKRCILGKFLGVVCHCFPPHLDVPTFATRCLNDARDPSGGRWNCGREI